MDYTTAGVNIAEGYRAVERYKRHAARTKIPGLLTELGSFNGMFAVPRGMKNPVMVSSTDGVGTKLAIAFQLKKYDTVGIDCVAMSVNDILCSGARPLFFLDYIACGTLDAAVAERVVKGIADGCSEAGCALLGGETAEMPGLYSAGTYDVAGCAVGIVDRHDIITGETIRAGDVLVGLSSTGLHSNGYSLVRKLVPDCTEPFLSGGKETGMTIGELLLAPTRIYVKPVLELLGKFRSSIHGMAHITGGGFYENIPRMYPQLRDRRKQLISVIDRSSWDIPPIFGELIRRGADAATVYDTFNMGIGFVLAVKSQDAETVVAFLNEHAVRHTRSGEVDMKAYTIGRVAVAGKTLTGEYTGNHDAVIFEG
ncbi:MAG: phosphoribosylformylglycinamidine cyclo-ligase [Treponema sp.]|nr:phosphoribosylformylglycinamidine cyclo-ligase [Treponema sp.]